MPFDKQKNQRKGFCFITFDSEQVVNELLKTPKQTISGKEVDVKKATPKPDNVPVGMGGPRGNPRGRQQRGKCPHKTVPELVSFFAMLRRLGWGNQGYSGYGQSNYGGYGSNYDSYGSGSGYDYYGGYGYGQYPEYSGYPNYGKYYNQNQNQNQNYSHSKSNNYHQQQPHNQQH